MISISQKCQYALRAVFELGKRQHEGPTKIGDIAAVQAIPPRFLELILAELKQAGIVESRRGPQGGYILAVPPSELTANRVISLVDGPIQPVKCVAVGGADCPLRGKCSFEQMWKNAGEAIAEVFDSTTFQDLIDREPAALAEQSASYCI